MQIQTFINDIFRQDFKSPAVLGRVLIGSAMLFFGLLSLFNVESYVTDLVPEYLPLKSLLVIASGLIFTGCGFALFANAYVKNASRLLLLILAALCLIVALPTGDVFGLAQYVSLIGGVLLIMHVRGKDVVH